MPPVTTCCHVECTLPGLLSSLTRPPNHQCITGLPAPTCVCPFHVESPSHSTCACPFHVGSPSHPTCACPFHVGLPPHPTYLCAHAGVQVEERAELSAASLHFQRRAACVRRDEGPQALCLVGKPRRQLGGCHEGVLTARKQQCCCQKRPPPLLVATWWPL